MNATIQRDKGKVVFIKGMKAIIQGNRRKSRVQKGDESHYSEEPREK